MCGQTDVPSNKLPSELTKLWIKDQATRQQEELNAVQKDEKSAYEDKPHSKTDTVEQTGKLEASACISFFYSQFIAP